MKDLLRTLLLGSALSVLAGGAIARQVEDLHCTQTQCAFEEELGPLQTKTFNGYCDAYKTTYANYSMTCHAVKGMTCMPVSWVADHWQCMCTNWKTEDQHTAIDVFCPGP